MHIGERHADFRALLRAITAALETIQGEDFSGEDPVLPPARKTLEERNLLVGCVRHIQTDAWTVETSVAIVRQV